MAILLTGGAGYIGSHIALELLNANYEVVSVDNYANSSLEALQRVQALTGKPIESYDVSLLDREGLETVFRNHTIEAVIHLAGLKAVGESVQLPLEYYRNNVSGTVVLLDVMQMFDIKKLVFSSSATVYAPGTETAIAEEHPLGPINPYGRTKWMIEMILQDLHRSAPEWSIACLRYFNPIGAHESGRIGEDPKGTPNNLFPYMTQVGIGKRPELFVFGADYDTPDGTGVRDYIHVMDLASGHVKAIEHVMASMGVEAYNLGTGQGYSVLQVVHAFEQATGKSLPYSITERRPGDVAVCYADPSKANSELKWFARRGIEEMCRDAWRWQSMYPDGYDKLKS